VKTFLVAFVAVFMSVASVLSQQPDLKNTLLRVYRQTMAAIEQAKTEADIERAVAAIDVPDWTSIDADGTRMTRNDAKRQLVASLGGQRGAQPTIELLWVNESGNSATAVAWVFAKSQIVDAVGEYGAKGARHDVLIGALIRDTWTSTNQGWRRWKHEKIFPNRVIAVDGKSVVLPLPPPS
jgi:hypothetical protein